MMFYLSKFLAIVSSWQFQFALILFAVIFGLIISIDTIVKVLKKKNKYIKRIEKHREFSKEDVFENFKEKNKYSDAFNKYIKPYIKKNPNLFCKMLNIIGIDLQKIQRQLLRANIKNITSEELASLKIVGFLAGIFISITTFPFLKYTGLSLGIGFYIYLGFIPFLKLDKKYNKRKNEIKEMLPIYLRLLASATSSGLTVEEAIRRVSEKYPCLLSEEFKKVENESKYTNNWMDALENMAFRNDIDELYNLVSEIKISKERGTPITDVLLKNAEKIETEKVLRSSETARKKSTLLILPIFLFLFAPLVTLIMLPAVSIMTSSF